MPTSKTMYQKAVKIARVVDENEATEREEVQAKRKFGSGSSNPQPKKKPKRVNLGSFKAGESNLKGVGR